MTKRQRYLLPSPTTGYDVDCVRVYIPSNETYRQAFWDHLRKLSKWTTWEHTGKGNTDAADAAGVWRTLVEATVTEYFLYGGCTMPYVTDVTGACPGGQITLDWSDDTQSVIDLTCLFSTSEAIGAATDSIINVAAYANLATLVSAWDGSDPTSINSNAPDVTWIKQDGDTSQEITDRDDALCYAAKALIDMICGMEMQRRNVGVGMAGIGLAVLAVLLAFVPAVGPLLSAAILAALGVAKTAFDTLSDAILTDNDARADVACCMYSNLRALDVTPYYFSQSLNDCCFTGGSNEAQLSGACAYILSEEDVFVAFVNLISEAAKYPAYLTACGCTVDFCDNPYFLAVGDAWGADSSAESECDGYMLLDSGSVEAVSPWSTLPGYCVAVWVPGWQFGYPRSIQNVSVESGSVDYAGLIWQVGGLQDWGATYNWNESKCGRLFAWWSDEPFTVKFNTKECEC